MNKKDNTCKCFADYDCDLHYVPYNKKEQTEALGQNIGPKRYYLPIANDNVLR